MKKSKIFLGILIPIVIILLSVAGVFIYLEMNSSPEKIFKTAIEKTFNAIKEKQNDYKTIKETAELSANIESDDESLKEIKEELEKSKILLNAEVDSEDLFINGNAKVIYNDENLINANLILQDEKIYLALKDWFDKYIEISDESYDFSQIKDTFDGVTTINKKLLIDSVNEELKNVISKQSFTKEKTKLDLEDGQTSVVKSSLQLNNKELESLLKDLLTNLKNNETFQEALGTSKEKIINNIEESLNDESINDVEEKGTITISIYTQGFLNQFVGYDVVIKNNEKGEYGLEFLKQSKTKSECYLYENNSGERKNDAKITFESNKNEGKIIITVPKDDKETELVCNYKKNNNQISYEINTETEGNKLNIQGNIIKEDNKYSGNAIISTEVQGYGTLKLNILYSIEYNTDIEKIDVSNSVKMDEMTEEDQQKLITNVQNSKLYNIINDKYLNSLNSAINDSYDIAKNIEEGLANTTQEEDDTTVVLDKFKIKYNVPDKLNYINYNIKNSKTYTDDSLSRVTVSIEEENEDDYLESLTSNYILSASIYSNQSITDILDYQMGNKTFKYRGITYKDTLGEYLNLYFTYKLSDDYTYVVEATIEGDSLSLDQITEFLNIEITNENTSI